MTIKTIRLASYTLDATEVPSVYQNQYFTDLSIEDAWTSSKGNGVRVALLGPVASILSSDYLTNYKGSKNVTGNQANGSGIREDDIGTFCASILAGLDDDRGTCGIAPEVDLYNVVALDSDFTGGLLDLRTAIRWCIDNNMDVICCTTVHDDHDDGVYKAIKDAHEAGIIIVCENSDYTNTNLLYPSAYPETFSVGRLAPDQQTSSATFVAPSEGVTGNVKSVRGKKVYSTYSGGLVGVTVASGIIALIIGHRRLEGLSTDPKDIEAIIRKTKTITAEGDIINLSDVITYGDDEKEIPITGTQYFDKSGAEYTRIQYIAKSTVTFEDTAIIKYGKNQDLFLPIKTADRIVRLSDRIRQGLA